jgi:alpha-ribazole phosphatase
MTLWLARHAQPLVESGMCYGALDVEADPELTRLAAQALARVLPPGIGVQVSPLKRCQQLALALQGVRGDLHFSTDARLREMNFGRWEGVAWRDIPRAAVDAWTADFASHRFGGHEGANDVLARVASAWDALPAGLDSLWIAHSGIAQAATLLHQGMRRVTHAHEWPLSSLPCGEWVAFQK